MAASIKIGNKEKRLFGMVVLVIVFAVVIPNTLSENALRYRDTLGAERSQLEGAIRQLNQDLGSIEEKRAQVRRYISSYRDLVARQVFAPPDTVNLVRQMRDIRDTRRQSAVDFSFSATEMLEPGSIPTTQDSSVIVNIYPMEIQMKMLHDLDLFMFIESLQEQVQGTLFPVSCSFELLEPVFAIQNRENLDGTCEINWYSINDPDMLGDEEAADSTNTADSGEIVFEAELAG